VFDPAGRSTDERGGISAQIREGRQEATKIEKEKHAATAKSTEACGQGATKVAESGTKGRREG